MTDIDGLPIESIGEDLVVELGGYKYVPRLVASSAPYKKPPGDGRFSKDMSRRPQPHLETLGDQVYAPSGIGMKSGDMIRERAGLPSTTAPAEDAKPAAKGPLGERIKAEIAKAKAIRAGGVTLLPVEPRPGTSEEAAAAVFK